MAEQQASRGPTDGAAGLARPGWLGLVTPRSAASILAAVLIGLAIWLLPVPATVSPRAMRGLAITAFAVVLWATVAVPQPVAALAFIALVVATGTASWQSALSGFASNAIWLVLGGILIGLAAERSGFGRYIARRALGGFRGSYPRMIAGILIGTTILSFLVPATMGRIAITVPVVLALAADAGYARGSNGYVGLVVAAVIGNFTIALGIMPGNLLNMMVLGSGETLYGTTISYMRYLLLCGPVLGAVKGLVSWLVIVWVYPAPPPRPADHADAADTLGADAWRVGMVLVATIALWSSDVVHGLRPGTVAAIAGLVCMLPGVGVLPVKIALDPRRLFMLVWVATVFSLGAVLNEAGASRLVSGALSDLAQIQGKSPLYAYFALSLLASLLAMLATIGGAIPIVTTAVGGFSQATGLPIDTGVLAVLTGMSAMFLPFAAAPIMVGLAMGKVDQLAASRFTIVSSLATVAIVLPLNALWWRLLGFLP